jgi:Protein of unknown function (DUF2442)
MRRKTQPVPQVMEGRSLGGYRVYLRFKDGVEGEVDLRPILMPFRGVFAELKDPKKFAKFWVDLEAATIVWPNGSDVAPEVLYESVLRSHVRPSSGV